MARKRSVRSGFEQRLLASLRACDIPSGAGCIVGFSGGADSLALAAGLTRVAPALDLHVQLVCVDHGLREDSTAHAQAAGRLAEELHLPFRNITLESGLPGRSKSFGLEEQARRERYIALAEAARDWGTDLILLGHQANDQAETVLLHLFRGSGIDGLSGMSRSETRPIPWWTGDPGPVSRFRVVRPLLAETRDEIDRYLRERTLTPIFDDSNDSLVFDRNWVRHSVLPAIEQRWPAAVETIARSAEVNRIDSDALSDIALEATRSALLPDRTLHTEALTSLPRGIANRIIRCWVESIGVAEPDSDVVARIYGLISGSDESRIVELGDNLSAVLDGDQVRTLDSLEEVTNEMVPSRFSGRPARWTVDLPMELSDVDARICLQEGVEPFVRTLRPGDRWYGTDRSVFEDLRAARIHPLMRGHLLAVATKSGGVLLIPAIYPTIHSRNDDEHSKMVGVRWRKVRP